MADPALGKVINKQIQDAVACYQARRHEFERFASTLVGDLLGSEVLQPLVHSTRWRTKHPRNLRAKLRRKAAECLEARRPFVISAANLFRKIEDLAGVRLLHLHTKQMDSIHPIIMSILREHRYVLVGCPVAYTWDRETEGFFKRLGITPRFKDANYTSVHYVIRVNRRTDLRCELQVRTLMEEVWGQVSHMIDYPKRTRSVACREQLKALARIASGGTRLVDSIFASHAEYKRRAQRRKRGG